MTRACVTPGVGEPTTVHDIELRAPGPSEVRVSIAAAGVCHSDLSIAGGTLAQPMPAVLGHEGAGVVEAVGAAVTRVAVGDHVVLNWAPACRHCWFCEHDEPWLCENAGEFADREHASLDGEPLRAGLGTGAFSQATVVDERAVIAIDADVPLDVAALLGCAVLTGVGAIRRQAQVRTGESVLVVGLGGVGLCALQGARMAGAGPVIAVDTSPDKEELARRCGATDFLLAGDDLAKRVRALTGRRGADVAVECVGRGATIRQAWASTRRGGRTVVVGIGPRDDLAQFNALELFYFARTLSGCVYGATDPDVEVPLLVEDWRAGRLDLAALVTDRDDLGGLDAAFERMRAGQGGRTLLLP